jgi:hypothetical protein
MYDFGLAVVQSPLALPARLDEISQPLWEKHCVKGLGRVVERELNGGHGLTEERLVKQAASACRSGLILAVASQCKRAPLEHLRQLLGNELDGLTGQVAGGGRRRELPELAELFSVAHWAAVVGAWIPSTPLNEAEFADTRQSDNTVAVRENLFGEFINMLSSTWPQGN